THSSEPGATPPRKRRMRLKASYSWDGPLFHSTRLPSASYCVPAVVSRFVAEEVGVDCTWVLPIGPVSSSWMLPQASNAGFWTYVVAPHVSRDSISRETPS